MYFCTVFWFAVSDESDGRPLLVHLWETSSGGCTSSLAHLLAVLALAANGSLKDLYINIVAISEILQTRIRSVVFNVIKKAAIRA